MKGQPIGILTLVTDGEGQPTAAVLNPEHAYFVTPPANCPDDWRALLEQAEANEEIVVVGMIVDGGAIQ